MESEQVSNGTNGHSYDCQQHHLANEPDTSKLKDVYTEDTPVPEVATLDDLVRELHKVFDFDRVNINYVQALLSAYRSNPADWKKYAKFDPFRYTRNLVDTGNGKFNLIALCWGEGHGSSIHDHSSSDCFVKVLDGELMETMYPWPSESQPAPETGNEPGQVRNPTDEDDTCSMHPTGNRIYTKDEVAYINDSMGLHRMSNPSHSNRTVSLHLYCPPFESCQVFDERSGKAYVAKVTFWSKYGERTAYSSPNQSAAKLYEISETASVSFCCQESVDVAS